MKYIQYHFSGLFVVFLLFLSVVLISCSVVDKAEKIKSTKEEIIYCKESRPQICTLQYMPACGVRKNETEKTYANDCNACSDTKVIYYRKGVCKINENQRVS